MDEILLERLRDAHEGATMVGWDFSVLDARLDADEPPWDFEQMCCAALGDADSALDMGTGGASGC